MQETLSTIYSVLLTTAKEYPYIMYLVLFMGSILDVVPPFCFFTYGELFFIPWAILAAEGSLNIWIVAPCAIFGGLLGDNISYFLGQYYGETFIQKLLSNSFIGKYFSEEKYKKLQASLHDKGGGAIFIARFSGPLAWVTPFIAGSINFPYRSFFIWNTPGAIGGISLFIFGGYFLGYGFRSILPYIENFIFAIIGGCIFLFLLYKNRKALLTFFRK